MCACAEAASPVPGKEAGLPSIVMVAGPGREVTGQWKVGRSGKVDSSALCFAWVKQVPLNWAVNQTTNQSNLSFFLVHALVYAHLYWPLLQNIDILMYSFWSISTPFSWKAISQIVLSSMGFILAWYLASSQLDLSAQTLHVQTT